MKANELPKLDELMALAIDALKGPGGSASMKSFMNCVGPITSRFPRPSVTAYVATDQ